MLSGAPNSLDTPLYNVNEGTEERLRDARGPVYLYELLGSASWGIYNVVYTYLLIDVGGYSTKAAAFWATLE